MNSDRETRIEALEILAAGNENTMRQWEGYALALKAEVERLREALRKIAGTPPSISQGWVHWAQQARDALALDEGFAGGAPVSGSANFSQTPAAVDEETR